MKKVLSIASWPVGLIPSFKCKFDHIAFLLHIVFNLRFCKDPTKKHVNK